MSVTREKIIIEILYDMFIFFRYVCRFSCISNKSYDFQDVGEDTDDMYDELLNNYGKVVYKKKDQKPASEEIDDDSESLSCKPIKCFVSYFAYHEREKNFTSVYHLLSNG